MFYHFRCQVVAQCVICHTVENIRYLISGINVNHFRAILSEGILRTLFNQYFCDKLPQVLWSTPPCGSSQYWRSYSQPSPQNRLKVRGKHSKRCLGLFRSWTLPSSASLHGTTTRAHCLRWVCFEFVYVTERHFITFCMSGVIICEICILKYFYTFVDYQLSLSKPQDLSHILQFKEKSSFNISWGWINLS